VNGLPRKVRVRNVMAIRIFILVIASVVSGCTTDTLVRGFILPDCPPGPTDKATSRAAACMTEAMYEIAQKKEETSRDTSTSDEDPQSDGSEETDKEQRPAPGPEQPP
jgi:hypothetical protein